MNGSLGLDGVVTASAAHHLASVHARGILFANPSMSSCKQKRDQI